MECASVLVVGLFVMCFHFRGIGWYGMCFCLSGWAIECASSWGLWGGMECAFVLGFSVMGLWNVLPF